MSSELSVPGASVVSGVVGINVGSVLFNSFFVHPTNKAQIIMQINMIEQILFINITSIITFFMNII
jgi:hypothetical protein